MQHQQRDWNVHELSEHIIKVSKGNPGCATIVSRLFVETNHKIIPFITALVTTDTAAPAVWFTFKDIAGGDLEAAWVIFEKWFTESTESLEVYLDKTYPEKNVMEAM